MTGWLPALQDECACIGCKQCVYIAQGTFRMEPAHGRSRVFAQWVDTEDDIKVRSPLCEICWLSLACLPAQPLSKQHPSCIHRA